jgi:hypothetical protein
LPTRLGRIQRAHDDCDDLVGGQFGERQVRRHVDAAAAAATNCVIRSNFCSLIPAGPRGGIACATCVATGRLG